MPRGHSEAGSGSSENNLVFAWRAVLDGVYLLVTVPPLSRRPLKYLESTTLQKSAAQNPHKKDLTSQNLESTGLTGRFLTASLPPRLPALPLPGQ